MFASPRGVFYSANGSGQEAWFASAAHNNNLTQENKQQQVNKTFEQQQQQHSHHQQKPKEEKQQKVPKRLTPEQFIQLADGKWEETDLLIDPRTGIPLSAAMTAAIKAQKKRQSEIEKEISQQNLYKTELCRSFEETGFCRYGTKCQFAHGKDELRPVLRHPKYKTEICRTFHSIGHCPYGKRCRFIHTIGKNLPFLPLDPSFKPLDPSEAEEYSEEYFSDSEENFLYEDFELYQQQLLQQLQQQQQQQQQQIHMTKAPKQKQPIAVSQVAASMQTQVPYSKHHPQKVHHSGVPLPPGAGGWSTHWPGQIPASGDSTDASYSYGSPFDLSPLLHALPLNPNGRPTAVMSPSPAAYGSYGPPGHVNVNHPGVPYGDDNSRLSFFQRLSS